MLMSTLPISGNRLPLSLATIARSAGSSLPGYSVSRNPGFASSTILWARRHSLKRNGPVPTGFCIAQPLLSPYVSMTSRATAEDCTVVRLGSRS